MPLLYWALETIQQTLISGGFIIVTTTDVACHQWLRHTLREPQKHAKPVMKRGLIMQWDARFCFVAYDDLEQNEAGDTYTHTFLWLGWENCQTRYFYFWAQSEGEKMMSTSPIFSKHYLLTAPEYTFYPDVSTGLVTCDGYLARTIANSTWASLVNGAGNWLRTDEDHMALDFRAYDLAATWQYLRRLMLTFDTSSIPPATEIITARLELHIWYKYDTLNAAPTFAVYAASPAQNNNLQFADYQQVGSIPLSPHKAYADIIGDTREQWHLNAAGIANINKGGISRFSFRESKYDVPNIPPPLIIDKFAGFTCWQSDKGFPEKPSLVVTYE